MKVTAQIYAKHRGRWRFLCEVSDDLDVNAGLGEDRGYRDFALDTARMFTDHEIVVQDPIHVKIKHSWRSVTVCGIGLAGVSKVRTRKALR